MFDKMYIYYDHDCLNNFIDGIVDDIMLILVVYN